MNREIKANVALIAAKAEVLNMKVGSGKIYASDVQHQLGEIMKLCDDARHQCREFEGGDR